MIENAYQRVGNVRPRKPDVGILESKEFKKEVRGQNGEIIQVNVKRVTLSNESKFKGDDIKFNNKAVDNYIEECQKIILKHYKETPPMLLNLADIKSDVICNLKAFNSNKFFLCFQILGLKGIIETRNDFKKNVIYPMVCDAIKNLNYKCSVLDILNYLNANDFKKTTGLEAKRTFIVNILKLNCASGNTDFRGILND